MAEPHHTKHVSAKAYLCGFLGTCPWGALEFYITLALRCRQASQARDVYFLPGRLRLAGSSAAAGVVMARCLGQIEVLQSVSPLSRAWSQATGRHHLDVWRSGLSI